MGSVSSQPVPKLATQPGRTRVPPLQPGDHLTRPEFERRYAATPDVKKAELIQGVTFVSPPVSYAGHGVPHFRLGALLGQYVLATPGIIGADNTSVRLDLDNMPQPDVFIVIPRAAGAGVAAPKVDDDDILNGAPDFVCEIAATSASIDLHWKLDLYRRHGVGEYVVWRTLDGAIDYFILRDGKYESLTPQGTGEYRSGILPGLWLDAAAVLRDDWAGAAKRLQEGLNSPEHAAFVRHLAALPR